MVISRGPARSIPVKPGDERAVFLQSIASLLQVDPAALDTTAPLVDTYGVDELEVFEYVQLAEDIWHVAVNPNPMTEADFAEMTTHFPTLDSIMATAERARR